jgi:addiction module RelE/StbE family toxin
MANYRIDVTDEAKSDLAYYTAFERKLVVSQIREQLAHEPSIETRNRKSLRDNPISTWELRIGKYRVFYEVDEAPQSVRVVSVGHKEHNTLFIRSREVRI